MIRSVRKKHSRPERVNYLASVSDLMSALLFVFTCEGGCGKSKGCA